MHEVAGISGLVEPKWRTAAKRALTLAAKASAAVAAVAGFLTGIQTIVGMAPTVCQIMHVSLICGQQPWYVSDDAVTALVEEVRNSPKKAK
jgi:hypothetical protein